MTDLIFHHYPNSPFAEKIRLVMGLKNLAWRSCDCSPVMPKPELQALTGGYRRIPVLQLGADVYCDSALIAEVLEVLAPDPTLYPKGQEGMARILAEWADSALFTVAMGYNFSPAGAQEFARLNPDQDFKAFVHDRAQMRGGTARLPAGEARSTYKIYLERLANLLAASSYILGDRPSIADFACYHALWFTRLLPAVADVLALHPVILPWMDRLAAVGHGRRSAQEVLRAESLQIARQAQPRPILADEPFVDEHSIALGSEVTITAQSFGLEATAGVLVSATASRFTLRREHPLTGVVHVHFPRNGYVLKRLESMPARTHLPTGES